MTDYKWSAIYCTDCGAALGYAPTELNQPALLLCTLCAHSYAEVAALVRPIGDDLITNSLYAVQNNGSGLQKSMQFRKVWTPLYDKVEAHRIAKCNQIRNAKLVR